MLGSRRAVLAAAARLARQGRCFSAVSRTVYPQQDAPAVFAPKQTELFFARGFAAAAEPAPAPSAAKGSVKTVGPQTYIILAYLEGDLRFDAPAYDKSQCYRSLHAATLQGEFFAPRCSQGTAQEAPMGVCH